MSSTSFPHRAPYTRTTHAPTSFPPTSSATNQQREALRQRHDRDDRAAQQHTLEALNDDQRDEVNEAFALFDLDKDNHIDYHELKVAMKALGFDLPKQEILGILSNYGVPASSIGNGKAAVGTGTGQGAPGRLLLPLQAFQTVMAHRIAARDPKEEILRAFELFDEGGKGTISLADLRRVARELGEGLQEEELAAMIEEFDLDGDGAISQEEFLNICLG